MIYGFTGTQHGMTNEQAMTFLNLISDNADDITEFMHGDCIGSDEQAHRVVKRIKGAEFAVDIYPPLDPAKRAYCASEHDRVHDAKPYLVRDRIIAEKAEVLVATPREFEEAQRSGTWATIRYASGGSLVLIIYPNGNLARNVGFLGKGRVERG